MMTMTDGVAGVRARLIRTGQSGRRAGGFSLIELMITVAIIGILAAIAYPSYSDHLRTSRRSDAIAFLVEAAGEQQRFFSDHNRYAATLEELGLDAAVTAVSSEGFYGVSVSNVDAAGQASEVHFRLTATPLADGPQAADLACGALTLNERGVKGSTGTAAARDCW